MLSTLKLPALLVLAAMAASHLNPRPASGDSCCDPSAVATCKGATPCNACKSCKSCGHCKGKGTCGTCSSADASGRE
jgi:hypothetical protein